ncbi:putative tRNA nucleotidyltransferase [Gregarina niphandrodes]|uniref:tRNA nucleotidyltransferase n=1 Tax=Gregarina niphandrodes TaxID=110365 RepID=A0A023AYB8_GRENI|nr:putative tRNA nucleotidyltransferase [Gregarina niphandrodes]EZG43651.1 putative tRNA nucleotidyltransferase [Gregarina niphandrodes]|eukprot:XP_011133125.1 putative tRNA nucleotidyltransferase [Gregarina niphandrodes]
MLLTRCPANKKREGGQLLQVLQATAPASSTPRPWKLWLSGGWVRDKHFGAERLHDFDVVAYPSDVDEIAASIEQAFKSLYPNAAPVKTRVLNASAVKARRQKIITMTIKHLDCRIDLVALKSDALKSANSHGGVGEMTDEVTEIAELLRADARRRDLTINALYYDPFDDCIIDPLGLGVEDLKNGWIRLIDGSQTLMDDPVRVIRISRFLSLYPNQLRLHPETWLVVQEHKSRLLGQLLHTVAEDRLRSEFCRLLDLPNRQRGLQFLVQNFLTLITERVIHLFDGASSKEWARRTVLEAVIRDQPSCLSSADDPSLDHTHQQ